MISVNSCMQNNSFQRFGANNYYTYTSKCLLVFFHLKKNLDSISDNIPFPTIEISSVIMTVKFLYFILWVFKTSKDIV